VIAAGPGADADGPVRVRRVVSGASIFYDGGAPDQLRVAPAALFSAAVAATVMRAARRWDAVCSHWLVPSAIAASFTGLPHLAIAHSGDVDLIVRLGLADVVAARVPKIAFVAEHLRARFLGALHRRHALETFVCPMGVVPPAPMDRAAARARFGLAADAVVLAFLGRLVPIKGVETLIDAAGDHELLIGGDGPSAPALRERARARGVRARFAGELRGVDRDALFAAADALVVPSIEIGARTEGAPQVVVEALAAGVPLVASDVPGVRALAGDDAALFAPGSAPALAAAIARVLDDPGAWRGRARARAAAHSWDAVGPRLSP
jgi:glycosyltransferase involved in cell wall biosynthesis